ncbi:phage tail tape measure protein [Neisseriaceae bacterium CCUG 44465]|uniref:phage tail tape measure protein n=1 Tax=Wielerella bovis TaxID=2917790 RepID=UPI00201914EB|nr:phage tail tape measure protein [Wielerella bovis]MCG7659091.1 phage tail tape measure protein [Wielerella bovis]
MNQTAQSSDQLGKESQDLSEKLALARAEATRLKQVWEADKGNDNARMAYVRQAGAVSKLEKSLTDLKNTGTHSHLIVAQAAETHGQKLNQIEQSLRQVKPSLLDVAGAFGSLTTAGGGLAYVANEAIKFESAMAQVKKVTDATPAQIAALSGSLKELGGQLGMMPDELAQIAAAGGQMGIAFEKLPAFTQMTAQMANAFNMTADAAGDMSAKISNVYGLTIEEMAELGDAMNTLGNNTAAKEVEIGNALMRIGGNAKQFGLLKEEAAALLAAFISLGKPPEVAATAINALLTKLQTATEQGNDFKDGLRDVGLSAQEMADNIAANPQAALTDFLQKMEKLDKQSRSITLAKMFGAEYSDDIALLVGGLETYDKALEKATDRTETFGAMQKEAGAALETTEGKMRQAKADIAAAAIDLGNALLPVVQATAVAVGGIADAVQAVSTQFPMLSQLAVLFAGAKVASMALGSAMKLAGMEGQTSFLKSDVGVKKLKASILETATAAKALGANMKNALTNNVDAIDVKSNEVKILGKNLAGAAQNALALYSAFEVGHSFGTALREQSDFVRRLGDGLGKAIAYADALVTDRTFEDVRNLYRSTSQEIREQEKAQREAAKAAQERAEKEKQANEAQAQKIRALTETYRAQQAQYQGNEQSLRVLTAAGKENSVIADQLREQNKQLEQQLAKTKDELGSLNANIADTSPLAKNRQALQDLGLSAEQVATGISQAAQKSLDDFKLAAQGFGNDADAMATIFQAAVKKMDTPEALSALKQSLNEAGQEAGLTAEQIDRIAQSAPQAGLGLAQISKPLGEAEAAATALGIELQNAFSGSSPAMQTALSHFTTLRGQLSELAAQGLDTGLIVQQSLSKLTETAQNQADIDALKQAIQGLGQSGALSLQEVERAILATDVRLQELKGTIDPTEAAFKKLGIQSKESLRLAAEETRLAFETVKASGNATSADLKAAFERTADALLASGDANQRAWVESQAAAYNYKVAVDETGKANLQAAEKTVQAAQTQVAAHNQVAQAATEAAQSVEKSSEKASQSIEQQGKRLSDFATKVDYTLRQTGAYFHMGTAAWQGVLRDVQDMYIGINQAIKQLNADTENGGNIAMSLAKAEAYAISNAHKLDNVTLNNLNQAIDKAKQKMAQLAQEAANARAEAEKELLRAQGRDDEVARLEQQQKIEQLRKQQAAAQKSGNRDAANDYEAAIVASNKAFEERLRREAEQREQARLEAEQREREKAEQQRQRELEKQQREQERLEQQRQRELEKHISNQSVQVNMQTDFSRLSAAIQKRDDVIADAAAQKLLSELEHSILQQR